MKPLSTILILIQYARLTDRAEVEARDIACFPDWSYQRNIVIDITNKGLTRRSSILKSALSISLIPSPLWNGNRFAPFWANLAIFGRKNKFPFELGGWSLELETIDTLASERLRLIRFNNRFIIDYFQHIKHILKLHFPTNADTLGVCTLTKSMEKK